MECAQCKSRIRGESGLRCDGVCKKVYHQTTKCAGIDHNVMKTIENTKMLKFICDDCMQYIYNVDLVLKEVQDSVNKNQRYLTEYKKEFEIALKKNEEEMKCLLKAMENRYMERINSLKKVQKVCEKNVEELNKFEENKKNFVEQIKEASKFEIDKQISYASVCKQNNPPILVRPKRTQSIKKTKTDLENNIDPTTINFKNIKHKNNGIVVIESENNTEREKIKSVVEEKLGETYNIDIMNLRETKLFIHRMKVERDENEIIEKIKKQNEYLREINMKVVKIIKRKMSNKSDYYNIILELDREGYHKAIERGKIIIGWDICPVYDGTFVRRCFKCLGFNHKAENCKHDLVCAKCLDSHKTEDCDKMEFLEKCSNCAKANKLLNVGVPEDHSVLSKLCPMYIEKLKIEKEKVNY